jgi:hypothetical protein
MYIMLHGVRNEARYWLFLSSYFYLVKVARDRGSRSKTNEKDITHEIMGDHKINLGRLYANLSKPTVDGAED